MPDLNHSRKLSEAARKPSGDRVESLAANTSLEQELGDAIKTILRNNLAESMANINKLLSDSLGKATAHAKHDINRSLTSDPSQSQLASDPAQSMSQAKDPLSSNHGSNRDPSDITAATTNLADLQVDHAQTRSQYCENDKSKIRPQTDDNEHSQRQTLTVYHTTGDVHNYVRNHSPLHVLGKLCGARCQRILHSLDIPEPVRTGYLSRFLSSKMFESGMLLIILINTLYTLDQTNKHMKHPKMQNNSDVSPADVIFTTVYVLELALKFLVHRCFFFWNQDKWWNIFDFIIVVVGSMEMLLAQASGAPAQYSPQFLRSLRIVRVAKIFRVIRVVQFVKELRLMLRCVVGSFVSLMWSFVLLAGVSLLFAAVLVQQMSTIMAERQLDPEQLNIMYDRFGSVQRALLTLFECISNGDEWGWLFTFTTQMGTMTAACFLLYVLFVWLSLTNIITAIFVEKALKKAKPDAEDRALQKHMQDLEHIHELQSIFRSIDVDGSSSLTLAELRRSFTDIRIISFFNVQGLDVKDIEMFFKLLTQVSNSAEVDMEAFVSGCLRMKGYATNIDVFSLLYQTKAFGERMESAIDQCNCAVQRLREELLGNAANTHGSTRESRVAVREQSGRTPSEVVKDDQVDG